MILRYFRRVVIPALGWALFVAAGFIGIGGMDLPAVASDRAIRGFWELGGLIAVISFIIAIGILTKDARRTGLLTRVT
jgi:hypothetical protein